MEGRAQDAFARVTRATEEAEALRGKLRAEHASVQRLTKQLEVVTARSQRLAKSYQRSRAMGVGSAVCVLLLCSGCYLCVTRLVLPAHRAATSLGGCAFVGFSSELPACPLALWARCCIDAGRSRTPQPASREPSVSSRHSDGGDLIADSLELSPTSRGSAPASVPRCPLQCPRALLFLGGVAACLSHAGSLWLGAVSQRFRPVHSSVPPTFWRGTGSACERACNRLRRALWQTARWCMTLRGGVPRWTI
jgi:hypothetical protein